MSQTVTFIGPDDHGRQMPLHEFELAEGKPGFLYELSRGEVAVIEVPPQRHLLQVNAIRKQLAAYDAAHPGRIVCLAAGGECKILLEGLQSERHPDLTVYQTPPPAEESHAVWSSWIPEIVIEVVSPQSKERDYHEKPPEYLQFGVREYWIVDHELRQMLVLQRSRGSWQEHQVRPPTNYATPLLPGLTFSIAAVFEAAGSPPN